MLVRIVNRAVLPAASSIAPEIIMLANVAHLDLELLWVARCIGHDTTFKELNQNRLGHACHAHISPERIGDRSSKGEERINDLSGHDLSVFGDRTALVHE